ncbi:MAG: YceK/YidQ family lipoprotein [Leptospiraceae bacterium]|nr:YceK/YidQ family lipoprotein [Leptospiraceae bacterium]
MGDHHHPHGLNLPLVFGGTRTDVQLFRDGESLVLLDLPFSFVMDTVLLPVTIPWVLLRQSGSSDSPVK